MQLQPSTWAGKRSHNALPHTGAVTKGPSAPGGDFCDPAHLIYLLGPFEPSPLIATYQVSSEIKGIEKNQ